MPATVPTQLAVKAVVFSARRRLLQLHVSWAIPAGKDSHALISVCLVSQYNNKALNTLEKTILNSLGTVQKRK